MRTLKTDDSKKVHFKVKWQKKSYNAKVTICYINISRKKLDLGFNSR